MNKHLNKFKLRNQKLKICYDNIDKKMKQLTL